MRSVDQEIPRTQSYFVDYPKDRTAQVRGLTDRKLCRTAEQADGRLANVNLRWELTWKKPTPGPSQEGFGVGRLPGRGTRNVSALPYGRVLAAFRRPGGLTDLNL